MMKIKKEKGVRSKYKSISSSERALIIHYIEEYKYSTSHVSMITGHNASTIKAIYQVYKKEGRVYKKDKRDKILNITTQLQLYVVDDTDLSLTSLDTYSYEKQIINDQEQGLKESLNQEVHKFCEKNKFKVCALLENKMVLESFNYEFNIINQQKDVSQLFRLINLNQSNESPERQETKLAMSKKLEKSLDPKNNSSEKDNLQDVIFRVLEEQYKMMKITH